MEPATQRRAERGPFRAAATAKRKLGCEERKELRGGGVAGEWGGVGGGAGERCQERVYSAGETESRVGCLRRRGLQGGLSQPFSCTQCMFLARAFTH